MRYLLVLARLIFQNSQAQIEDIKFTYLGATRRSAKQAMQKSCRTWKKRTGKAWCLQQGIKDMEEWTTITQTQIQNFQVKCYQCCIVWLWDIEDDKMWRETGQIFLNTALRRILKIRGHGDNKMKKSDNVQLFNQSNSKKQVMEVDWTCIAHGKKWRYKSYFDMDREYGHQIEGRRKVGRPTENIGQEQRKLKETEWDAEACSRGKRQKYSSSKQRSML